MLDATRKNGAPNAGLELLHWQLILIDVARCHGPNTLHFSCIFRNCVGSRTEASQNGESGKSRSLENALCVGDCDKGVLSWILSHTPGCLWFNMIQLTSTTLWCSQCLWTRWFSLPWLRTSLMSQSPWRSMPIGKVHLLMELTWNPVMSGGQSRHCWCFSVAWVAKRMCNYRIPVFSSQVLYIYIYVYLLHKWA